MKLYKTCTIAGAALRGSSKSDSMLLTAKAAVMTALDMINEGCEGLSVVGLRRHKDDSVELVLEGDGPAKLVLDQ